MAGCAAGLRNGAGHLARIDPAIGHRVGVFVGVAIGARRRRAAVFALGKSLIDAIAVGLIGDEKDLAVRARGGGKAEEQAGGEDGKDRSHGAPGRRGSLYTVRRERLRMINDMEGLAEKSWPGVAAVHVFRLTDIPPLDHCAGP